MTRPDRLAVIRERASSGVTRNTDLIFRHHLTFRLGAYPPWEGRFSVKDPQRLKPDEVRKLQIYASGVEGLNYLDLRQIKPHPDEVPPYPGSTAEFDDGILEILEWSQPSDFVGHTDADGNWVGQRTGTAVLRR